MSERHTRQPPLAGRYPPVAAGALLALCPNIVLTTAVPLLQPTLAKSLHTDLLCVQTGESLSNAGYALGAVVAAFLVQRFQQRVLFLATEVAFVAASVLAATAPSFGEYVVGRTAQGAATGLMLVLALPPLVTRFGVRALPRTAALVNIGLFGAVTVGPLLGGAVASPGAWRLLFLGVAVAGAAGVVVAVLGLRRDPPFDPEMPPDWSAFTLAAAGTFLPFVAISRLTSLPASAPAFWVPLAVGLGALGTLIVRQYQRRGALMPVRALSTALPVVGTGTAMIAGAGVITLMSVASTSLVKVQGDSPLTAGLLLAPEIGGVAVAALVFALLLRTRYLPALLVAGMLLVAGAAGLLLHPTQHVEVLAAAALLGLGAGATVSPGLFLAAFGVESSKIGRAFALVELLRSEAAYLTGPMLLFVAESQPSLGGGLRLATWAVLGLVLVGGAVLVALYRASGVHPEPPDLRAWIEDDQRALHSPPTAAAAREHHAASAGLHEAGTGGRG